MALSNWDTLAVDLDGEPINGVFVSPCGIRVEFYKNWIYVYDEKGWTDEKSGFCKPCVAQVQHGELRYKDVFILAKRGPQEGIFAVVTSGYNKDMDGMVGCGVYGYDGEEWLGVTPKTLEHLQEYLQTEEVCNFGTEQKMRQIKLDKALRFNQGDAYFTNAGVLKDIPATEAGAAEQPVITSMLKDKA